MKPNDENGKRPTAERPFRILVIAGSHEQPQAKQEALGINRDATLSPKKGEGERRRQERDD